MTPMNLFGKEKQTQKMYGIQKGTAGGRDMLVVWDRQHTHTSIDKLSKHQGSPAQPKYIQYPVITHTRQESQNDTCITHTLCHTPEK